MNRYDKALRLLADQGQWIKVWRAGRPLYYGIRSESDPTHHHLVNRHHCCCRWMRGRPSAPCSHILAVRMHVENALARRAAGVPALPSAA